MKYRKLRIAVAGICFLALLGSILEQVQRGELVAHMVMGCAFGSLAVILLVIRDSRGRFSLATLLVLVSFAALMAWAIIILVRMPLHAS